MPTSEYVRRALREINTQQHTEFELLDRAAGGMNGGAWFVAEDTGYRAVLKLGLGWELDHLRRAGRAVQSVRASGYPTPAWIAVGATQDGARYLLQEFLDGEPGDPLTADKARQLVHLIERQQGLDPWPERDWNTYIHADFDDIKQRVRTKVPEANALVDVLDRVPKAELPTGDLVHGDFNSCNVLLKDGQVQGAIDIEALGSGSRVIDYAWLLREAYAEGSRDEEIFRVIRTAGQAVAGPEALAFCMAFNACGWLLWMKDNEPSSIPGILGGLHRLAADLI